MNLWADFDNEHPSIEAARPRQTRRLTEYAILSSVRQWLVQDYASAYCRALGTTRLYRRCYWIDAWGIDAQAVQATENTQTGTSKGRKAERAASSASHPVLQPILALSQTLAQESKPIVLNGLVLAAGSSRRKEARMMLNGKSAEGEKTPSSIVKDTALTLPRESGILPVSWLEVAAKLLRAIEHAPAIFLLNPFGQTLLTYDDLALLYQRTSAPTELCLLVPHKQAELRLMAAARSAANASALTALLRTDRWKALLPKEEGAAYNLAGMLDILQNSMQQHFLWVQAITLEIQTGPVTVESAPYTLLFATRRKDSLISMNDAICVYHRHLYQQSRRGILAEDWFATQEQERLVASMQQLCQRILQLGQAQRIRRWPDLRQQLILANFGQFTLAEYDEVIRDLLLKGNVRCEWRRRPIEGEEQRVPGNDDMLIYAVS